ncbi:nucleoside hydrolase [Oribacterium sp. HCP3S3_B9]|uniref:nucleoside hydrolase n=1 Tax=Oribacterium sp. HCP3S3_B9 TaxID=3438946 RepID=UPI003F8A751C
MKRKVILDCDPGIDDSLAIMLALSSPELDVRGITIVTGNAPLEMGYGNARKVLHFLDREDVPVYLGADRPLKRDYISALDTHGADGLGESFLPNIELRSLPASAKASCSASDATGITADTLQRSNTSVDIGRSEGKRPKLIRMVGLDVTRQIVLTPTLLEYMELLHPEVGGFVRKITKFYFDFHWAWEGIIGCVINDPLAVAAFLDPTITSGFAAYTDIETGGISIGQSVVDVASFYQKPANADIMTEVDVAKFWRLFLPRLVGKTAAECPLLPTLI